MDSLYDGFDVTSNHPPNQNSSYITSNDSENQSMNMMSPSMNMMDSVRPMTSNKSAGYSSSRKNTQIGTFSKHKSKEFRFGLNGRGSGSLRSGSGTGDGYPSSSSSPPSSTLGPSSRLMAMEHRVLRL